MDWILHDRCQYRHTANICHSPACICSYSSRPRSVRQVVCLYMNMSVYIDVQLIYFIVIIRFVLNGQPKSQMYYRQLYFQVIEAGWRVPASLNAVIIAWTNDNLLPIGPLRTNVSKMLIKINNRMGLNVLNENCTSIRVNSTIHSRLTFCPRDKGNHVTLQFTQQIHQESPYARQTTATQTR